jgi:hypothetical protein
MEPKDSLPYSQEPSTGPYMNWMNPVHTIPSNFSKNYFNIILPSTSKSSTTTITAVKVTNKFYPPRKNSGLAHGNHILY